MNPTTIQTLIESGENSRTEFKSGAFHNDPTFRTSLSHLPNKFFHTAPLII